LPELASGAAPLLITGGSGQIGGALVRLCAHAGIAAIAPARDALDLSDREQLTDCILTQQWSGVVNCAAYTAVDQAEVEQELAGTINAQAPATIAEACARANIPLVHLSTDYVFNGTKNEPYVESDTVDPIGIYGLTKAEGERAVQAANGSHAIVRTAWVLSAGPRNFLTTMLRLAADRDE
jgi:dTDP-4-dehydrorhamnose reductase